MHDHCLKNGIYRAEKTCCLQRVKPTLVRVRSPETNWRDPREELPVETLHAASLVLSPCSTVGVGKIRPTTTRWSVATDVSAYLVSGQLERQLQLF